MEWENSFPSHFLFLFKEWKFFFLFLILKLHKPIRSNEFVGCMLTYPSRSTSFIDPLDSLFVLILFHIKNWKRVQIFPSPFASPLATKFEPFRSYGSKRSNGLLLHPERHAWFWTSSSSSDSTAISRVSRVSPFLQSQLPEPRRRLHWVRVSSFANGVFSGWFFSGGCSSSYFRWDVSEEEERTA